MTDHRPRQAASHFSWPSPRCRELAVPPDGYLPAMWKLMETCNFDCHYCFGNRAGLAILPVDVANVIRSLRDTGEKWVLHLVGGEVLLVPGFVDICHALVSSGIRINVETNLSVRAAIDDFIRRIDPGMVQVIIASLHIKERERRPNGVEDFVANFTGLRRAGFRVFVDYVMHPSLFERLEADDAWFKSQAITIRPVPFVGDYAGRTYPDAYTGRERARILNLNPDAGGWGPLKCKGVPCKAGMKSVRISVDGTVYRCGAEEAAGVVGNVASGIALLTEPRPCPVDVCRCWGWLLLADRHRADALARAFRRPSFSVRLRRNRFLRSLYNAVGLSSVPL